MTEFIFGLNLFDVYFDFLVWPMSHLLTWRFMSYTGTSHPGGDRDVLASLSGRCHVIHLYIRSMVFTESSHTIEGSMDAIKVTGMYLKTGEATECHSL